MANKKSIKITFNAPVVLGFSLCCVAALVLNLLTGGASNRLVFSTYHSSLANILTYIRFFTHVLGHSGWAHLTGNMVYILLLGPMLEEKYGSNRILEVIAATALATGLVNWFLFPGVVLCGASGVCFAFILLSSFAGVKKGEIPVTFILIAVIYLGQQVLDGIFIANNISNMAHIVGGIVGALFGFMLTRSRK